MKAKTKRENLNEETFSSLAQKIKNRQRQKGFQKTESKSSNQAKVRPISLGKNTSENTKAENTSETILPKSEELPSSTSSPFEGNAFTPDQLYTMAKMGYTQWEFGKLDRARAIFQTLIKAKPDESWFHCALGSIYQKEKHYAQALQQYNIALQLNPKDLPSLVNRGEIFLKVGKREEGVRDLMTAIKGDPPGQNPSALRAKALLQACRRQLK